jgi:hypothetical protein
MLEYNSVMLDDRTLFTMAARKRLYLSYLLRLWRTGSEENPVWRVSLETPGTGERRGFAGLKDLFDFLQAQTEIPPKQNLDPDTQNTKEEPK